MTAALQEPHPQSHPPPRPQKNVRVYAWKNQSKFWNTTEAGQEFKVRVVPVHIQGNMPSSSSSSWFATLASWWEDRVPGLSLLQDALHWALVDRWLWELFRNGPALLGFCAGARDEDVCARLAPGSSSADWIALDGLTSIGCRALIERSYNSVLAVVHVLLYVCAVVSCFRIVSGKRHRTTAGRRLPSTSLRIFVPAAPSARRNGDRRRTRSSPSRYPS